MKNGTVNKKNKIYIIGGTWRHRPIRVLDMDQLRPSPARVRETLFNWLGQKLTNLRCIDLFAGSGILGFEAASRGAEHVIMIEKNKLIYRQLLYSMQSLKADNIDIIFGNALEITKRLPKSHFDLVFLDPPFHAPSKILNEAIIQASQLIKENGALYVEAPELLKSFFESSGNSKHWQCIKQGKAGQVFYHLFRQVNSMTI